MHQPIRDNLEEYLRGSAHQLPQEFHAHLEACEDCAKELRLLEQQSNMLRTLQNQTEAEPRAGFYARVLERIEAQRETSIWSVFLDRKFGLRLAVASAALALLLGGYLVSTEPGTALALQPAVVLTDTPAHEAGVQYDAGIAADNLQQQQQRDAVLVDLASYHE
jgi:predicted anti-sigma-YlaC factor YlaD